MALSRRALRTVEDCCPGALLLVALGRGHELDDDDLIARERYGSPSERSMRASASSHGIGRTAPDSTSAIRRSTSRSMLG